jgi:hypothetical protein
MPYHIDMYLCHNRMKSWPEIFDTHWSGWTNALLQVSPHEKFIGVRSGDWESPRYSIHLPISQNHLVYELSPLFWTMNKVQNRSDTECREPWSEPFILNIPIYVFHTTGQPRVEAGKNSSSVIPATRKRRRKGNLSVSDETAMYGYKTSATLTTDITLQNTDPSSCQRGGPKTKGKQIFRQKKGKRKFWSWTPKGCPIPRRTDWQTDWLTVSCKVSSTSKFSDETVKYGYGFCVTWTIEWLYCKLQTRPLVRESAPQKQDRKSQTATFRQEVISGRKSHKSARHHEILTDWLTVSRKVTSTFELPNNFPVECWRSVVETQLPSPVHSHVCVTAETRNQAASVKLLPQNHDTAE